jgi:RNA polymerase sigma-70 factor (ECF subfamily)
MPNDLQSEQHLIQRARNGDQASWRAIYESTCDRLFAFLCYQMGDRDEAKDVLQETYLQAFRKLETFRGDSPIEVWLRAIALGRSIDWKRVILRRFKRTSPLSDSIAQAKPMADDVRFDSERATLQQALATLSRHQRAALLLRELEGFSFRDIAQSLGCGESTARVHHARAREHMRAALCGDRRPATQREWEGQET